MHSACCLAHQNRIMYASKPHEHSPSGKMSKDLPGSVGTLAVGLKHSSWHLIVFSNFKSHGSTVQYPGETRRYTKHLQSITMQGFTATLRFEEGCTILSYDRANALKGPARASGNRSLSGPLRIKLVRTGTPKTPVCTRWWWFVCMYVCMYGHHI